MAVETKPQPSIVRFLGLTPVSSDLPTTDRNLIHPLAEPRGIQRIRADDKIPLHVFYRDGAEANEAFLLLTGAASVSRHTSGGVEVTDIISAPALVGGTEFLAGGSHQGTAVLLTDRASFQSLWRSERWSLYQDPVHARSLALALVNSEKQKEFWADLRLDKVPERMNSLLGYLRALGTQYRLAISSQEASAKFIAATRESVSKALRENPAIQNDYNDLVARYFFYAPKPKNGVQ